ncbi:hypothetical protein VHA_001312 [Grimontia hollisae CIP 101886]|uniref:Uncharacterized protein n=1 Tax=Grimontia hollisae CIP 101886 TaxID=675812 RepID=D0I6E5_GRIHO|nr:hypothetical protein VHA_001312 [Grimontia hollisae CIP 101886]
MFPNFTNMSAHDVSWEQVKDAVLSWMNAEIANGRKGSGRFF